jgi:hypothetical protein
MSCGRTTPTEFAQVEFVGREDEIEFVEIRCVHLAGALSREIIAARAGVADGARIGRIADVIILRPGGIELDAQPGLPGLDAEDFFRGRRPADITHAHQ